MLSCKLLINRLITTTNTLAKIWDSIPGKFNQIKDLLAPPLQPLAHQFGT